MLVATAFDTDRATCEGFGVGKPEAEADLTFGESKVFTTRFGCEIYLIEGSAGVPSHRYVLSILYRGLVFGFC